MWHSVYFSSMFLLVNSSPFTTLVTMIGQQFHFYSGWLQAKATNQVTNWWEFIVNLVFISTAIISLPLFIQAWIPRSYPKVVKQLDNFVGHWLGRLPKCLLKGPDLLSWVSGRLLSKLHHYFHQHPLKSHQWECSRVNSWPITGLEWTSASILSDNTTNN